MQAGARAVFHVSVLGGGEEAYEGPVLFEAQAGERGKLPGGAGAVAGVDEEGEEAVICRIRVVRVRGRRGDGIDREVEWEKGQKKSRKSLPMRRVWVDTTP